MAETCLISAQIKINKIVSQTKLFIVLNYWIEHYFYCIELLN